jgi:uncharacterized Tic20 family protein
MLKTTAISLMALLLAAAHVAGTLPVPSSQSQESQVVDAKSQETVNLAISGMT